MIQYVFPAKPESGKYSQKIHQERIVYCTSVFQAFVTTLSQVSAKLTPRQSHYKNTLKNNSHNVKPVVCLDSFLETVQNFDFSIFKNVHPKCLLDSNHLNKFKVSYISSDSFFENKHGLKQDHLMKDGIPTFVIENRKHLHVPQGLYQKLVHGLLFENRCAFNIQLRGFKTERSVHAEDLRNPSLGQRLKNAFGFTQPENLDAKLTANPLQAEKLKTMLSNNDIIPETEKDRIKIAFAEGYLHGNNTNVKGGKATRYFKLVQQILSIFLFLGLIIALMASVGGSAFR